MNKIQLRQSAIATAIASVLLGRTDLALADTTLSSDATADTFLTSYSAQANSDMSSYGAMMISAPVADPQQGISEVRSMESIVAYNTATIKAGFDSQYGVGNWHVTDVQLEFYTNFDIPGVPANNNQFNVPAHGAFNISLMDNNSWFNPATAGATGLDNGNVTWNSVYGAGGTYSTLFNNQTAEGTFNYTDYPGGNTNGTTACTGVGTSCDPRFWDLSLTSALVNDIISGSYVSFHGTAADNQVVYLINQLTKPGAHPQIYISAAAGASAVPIPAAAWLFLSAAAPLLAASKRRGLTAVSDDRLAA